MFQRDATQVSFTTRLAHRLGLRRESHVYYLIFAILLFIFYLFYTSLSLFGPNNNLLSQPFKRILTPMELVKNDASMVYETVPNSRGLVMLFHGCQHQAMDWFTLPEERRIVQYLLNAQFSVLAFNAVDRESGCWSRTSDPMTNQDLRLVSKGLRGYLEHVNLKLKDVPIFALGASSGGTFVTILCRQIPLHGAIIAISPGDHRALLLPIEPQVHAIPPLTFIYMSRDTRWASRDAIDKLISDMYQTHGSIPNPIIYEAKPHPLTHLYLHEHIPTISKQDSERFYQIALEKGWIEQDGMIKKDPRETAMQGNILGEMDKEHLKLREPPIQAAIEESLNVLYANHELTSEYVDKWVPWILEIAKHAKPLE